MRVCVGLIMLLVQVPYVLSPGVLAFNWSAGFGTSSGTINTAPTTLNAIQAASQSTFINAQL
jgi:hypothetical protein